MSALGVHPKKIVIASDHAGFEFKEKLQKLLPEFSWEDLGPSNSDSVNYPEFAKKVGEKITTQKSDFGLLVCGSGVGVSIAANKIKGIRAALVENPVAARLSREHNNANVLCFGSRFMAPEYAAEITRIFLTTPFSDEARHQKRLDQISEMES